MEGASSCKIRISCESIKAFIAVRDELSTQGEDRKLLFYQICACYARYCCGFLVCPGRPQAALSTVIRECNHPLAENPPSAYSFAFPLNLNMFKKTLLFFILSFLVAMICTQLSRYSIRKFVNQPWVLPHFFLTIFFFTSRKRIKRRRYCDYQQENFFCYIYRE